MKVIGVGNPFRGDDGAGIYAARLLRDRRLPGIEVVEHHGEPASLIETWDQDDDVVIVDAIRSGARPGTVHVLYPDRAASARVASSHGLGIGDAIALARALGRMPRRLVLVGIECGSVEISTTISPLVREAAEQVADDLASGRLSA